MHRQQLHRGHPQPHQVLEHRDIHRHPEAKTREGVQIVRFEAPIFFANADYFRQSVRGLVEEQVPSPDALVLVCDPVSDIDLTGLDALRDLVEDVQRAGIELRMCRVKGPVHDALVEKRVRRPRRRGALL